MMNSFAVALHPVDIVGQYLDIDEDLLEKEKQPIVGP